MGKFSFLNNQIEDVVGVAKLSVPGVEKIIAIYNTPDNKKLYTYEDLADIENSTNYQIDTEKIKDFTKRKNYSKWLGKRELPYIETSKINIANRQEDKGIYEEIDRQILCASFSRHGNKKTICLLFLYFSEKGNEFNLSHKNEAFDPKNKKIIETLFISNLQNLLDSWQNDILLFNHFKKYKDKAMSQKILELKQSKQQKRDFAIDIINFTNENGKNFFKLSDDALVEIMNFNGDLFDMQKQIYKTVEILTTSNSEKSQIVIEAHDLSLMNINIPITENKIDSNNELEIKYPDVEIFLDNLEKAVEKVYGLGLKITGKNVSEKIIPKLGESAINQKINNKDTQIKYLVNKNKSKWLLSQKYFKPLRNMLQNNNTINKDKDEKAE